MVIDFHCGHSVDVLGGFPENHFHLCVTSPPYWCLRSYKTDPQVWGGDPLCEHEWTEQRGPITTRWADGTKAKFSDLDRANAKRVREPVSYGDMCSKCGAWRGELGHERRPDQYIEHLAEVFAAVRRVLRKDGSLWIVIGDTYASGKGRCNPEIRARNSMHVKAYREGGVPAFSQNRSDLTASGLKPKELAGIPWRLAFRLQAQGWWWRSVDIWHKPNGMPYQGKDRTSCAHEYVLMFTKSKKNYWDVEATREPLAPDSLARSMRRKGNGKYYGSTPHEIGNIARGENYGPDGNPEKICNPLGRQMRSVRTVANRGTRRKHFAVYPVKLIEPYILSGTSERGCCPECGAPWARIIEWHDYPDDPAIRGGSYQQSTHNRMHELSKRKGEPKGRKFPVLMGWQPSCRCNAGDPVPCRVLDPFAGSGTTGIVCERFNRDAVLIDLNPDFVAIARERIHAEGHPLFI